MLFAWFAPMHAFAETPPSTDPDAEAAVWTDRPALLLESTGEGIFGIGLDGHCVLQLDVQDDGVGAAAQAFSAPTAYGVRGMRERARHFGGTVEAHSAPGRGCTFGLRLPLTGA